MQYNTERFRSYIYPFDRKDIPLFLFFLVTGFKSFFLKTPLPFFKLASKTKQKTKTKKTTKTPNQQGLYIFCKKHSYINQANIH